MISLLDYATEQRFDALIFDCDGTLANTSPVHYRAFSEAFAEQGQAMDRAWYFARIGFSRDQVFDQFEREFGAKLDRAALAERSRVLFFDYLHDVDAFDAVAAVARHFRGRVPMAVASGGQRPIVEATLRALDLLPLFDAIVAVEDVAHSKPAPDVFLEAARRLKAAPTACLVFEDSDEGLEAARRAGMDAKDVRAARASAA